MTQDLKEIIHSPVRGGNEVQRENYDPSLPKGIHFSKGHRIEICLKEKERKESNNYESKT